MDVAAKAWSRWEEAELDRWRESRLRVGCGWLGARPKGVGARVPILEGQPTIRHAPVPFWRLGGVLQARRTATGQRITRRLRDGMDYSIMTVFSSGVVRRSTPYLPS